jgi:Raf kinase inhibitor-like YbhB/YbcL family protein
MTDRRNKFTLKSSAFRDGARLPKRYQLVHSPPLQWKNAPETTQSYALIVEDEDRVVAGLFTHWIIYNLPATMTEIREGRMDWPDGTVVLPNSVGNKRYDGPFFSVKDHREHRYRFRLIALNVPSIALSYSIGTDQTKIYKDLTRAIQPFVIGEATLTTTYNAMEN